MTRDATVGVYEDIFRHLDDLLEYEKALDANPTDDKLKAKIAEANVQLDRLDRMIAAIHEIRASREKTS